MLKDDEFSPEIKSAIENLISTIRTEFPKQPSQRQAAERARGKIRRELQARSWRGGRKRNQEITDRKSVV